MSLAKTKHTSPPTLLRLPSDSFQKSGIESAEVSRNHIRNCHRSHGNLAFVNLSTRYPSHYLDLISSWNSPTSHRHSTLHWNRSAR